ncbi:NAD(P)-dependent alcohol dehydrogenase [Wenjunlia tyrosinilytica]|nr:NAD(P)-dependent alcohol dehydrogenase [Wenjunlia tyrosinilytica]
MKAIVQERFGPPDILQLADTDRPGVGANQVLVRVHAAALNPYDWHMMRGDPLVARLMGAVGLTRPKSRVAGIDAAGRVAAVGADVRGFEPGDEVMGFCPGSFAEYARTTTDLLVPKPASLTFEEAAAVPMGAVTALRGIRTVGRVRPGQRVLVNGSAGGVGTFAVQIAAALGAEVTGVCSTRNVELVRSLGAAHVVDYTREDFTDGRVHYDVILDNVGNRPLSRLRKALTSTGTLVANGGGSPGHAFGAVGSMLQLIAFNTCVRQRLRLIHPAAPAGPTHEDLLAVTALIEAGKLTPVVDRIYPLADTAEGVRHVEQGHARGKAVVTVP